MIKVQQLNKFFNKRKSNEIHVIHDVTLEFPQKGLVVLLGASGSGKTTLLNVIGGLDSVQSGTIEFNENIIKKYNANTWDAIRTKNIGYVFQNYNLLKDLSIYDNIAFVLNMIGIYDKEEIEKRVHYILKAVNMFKFKKRKASQLSGGQQQRVAIARALVKNPQIIIADEPTGNLDSENTLDVMNILRVISKEKLVVLVTHEKEIANFYADRIIEIKDGKVVNDKQVVETSEHSFKNDNVIYLKDLQEVSKQTAGNVTYSVLADNPSDLENLNVKLILKNKTLYLDVASNLHKVKLLDDNVGVKVVNEHFKTKTRDEITNTNFELDVLNNDSVAKQTRSTISFKKSLRLAFNKVANTTKRGKLMFFAFILSGVLLAFASSYFFAALDVNPYDLLEMPENYIMLVKDEDGGSTQTTYNNLKALSGDDENFYVHVHSPRQLPFWTASNNYNQPYVYLSSGSNYASYGLSNHFDIVDHVKESDLTMGNLPQNDYEFVIDDLTASHIMDSYANDYGVWSKEKLLNEEIRVKLYSNSTDYLTLKISGIVDTEVSVSYFTKPMLTMLSRPANTSYTVNYTNSNEEENSVNLKLGNHMPLEIVQDQNAFGELNLVAGTLPTQNTSQILISSMSFYNLENNFDYENVTFPFTINFESEYETLIPLQVTGIFDNDYFENVVSYTSNLEQLKYTLIQSQKTFTDNIYVYSSNPTETLKAITSANIDAEWTFQTAKEMAKSEIAVNISLILTSVLVLLALNSLGFYFIIRSSMINRIYEISVYRALGVKKFDIVKLFMIEILFLLTITSLIGYMLGSVIASQIAELFASFQVPSSFFVVNPLSFVAGLATMYGINLLFGLLPVWTLLRKTPSEILSKYDI